MDLQLSQGMSRWNKRGFWSGVEAFGWAPNKTKQTNTNNNNKIKGNIETRALWIPCFFTECLKKQQCEKAYGIFVTFPVFPSLLFYNLFGTRPVHGLEASRQKPGARARSLPRRSINEKRIYSRVEGAPGDEGLIACGRGKGPGTRPGTTPSPYAKQVIKHTIF